jgi:transposase-like protein
MSRYPPELKTRTIELYKSGLSVSKIAQQLGISAWTVRYWIREAGVKRGTSRKPPELKERAIEMLKAGVPAKQVAKLLGVSYQTVMNWKREAGLVDRERAPCVIVDVSKLDDITYAKTILYHILVLVDRLVDKLRLGQHAGKYSEDDVEKWSMIRDYLLQLSREHPTWFIKVLKSE